jgi:hypothetical protein
MSELLDVKYMVRRLDNNTIYCEFYPTNLGIENAVMHGNTLPIEGTITDTIVSYLPIARAEMLAALNERFPGEYV